MVNRQDVDREDWTAINAWISEVLTAVKHANLQPVGAEGAAAAAAAAASAADAPVKHSKANPYWAQVVAIEGLCNITDAEDKNTVGGGMWGI